MADSMTVTGFGRSLKYSLHLPKISLLLSISFVVGSTDIRFFAAKTLDGLHENVVVLPAVGIKFMCEIRQRLHFRRFQREGSGLSRHSVPRMQRRFGYFLKPCLVGYFLYSNSIFHLLVPPRGYF